MRTTIISVLLVSVVGCGSVAPVDPCNPGFSLSVNRPGVCCPDGFLYAADDGFCYTDYEHARNALACQPGWMPSVNDPRRCCPADEPYFYSDGQCYPDLDTARILNALRAYCAEFVGYDDRAIVTIVRSFRADREAGYTYAESIAGVSAGCSTIACGECGNAVVDFVY